MSTYPKDDLLYVKHMLNEIEKMQLFIADDERDDKTFYAVIRCFEVMSEASKHISDGFKQQHAKLPWQQIKGMRNALVHDYLGINPKSLWDTVNDDIPPLQKQLEKLLNTLEK